MLLRAAAVAAAVNFRNWRAVDGGGCVYIYRWTVENFVLLIQSHFSLSNVDDNKFHLTVEAIPDCYVL